MKIIDKTPFQTEKGEISLMDRLQGTLKYGFSWYPELAVQKNIITHLDRALEKGFVLIRNLTLPGSEIVEPIILIGQGGIYVIYVTHLRGYYEAKGDQWNIDNGGRFKPAPINLMSRVARLAKVLTRYLQTQNIELPVQVEPVLIAADPGLHVDSMRPAVRVVQSDAIKQFAASLLQARPVFRTEFIYDLADRIVTPRPKSEPPLQVPAAPVAPEAAPAPVADNPAVRAHAIFNASEQAQPLNPSDVSFALQDESAGKLQELRDSNPAQPSPKLTSKKRGIGPAQWALLGFIVIVEFCILAGFGYLIFFSK
jgi:Nuclease-related domain